MAINSPVTRRASVAVRPARLPWSRRFKPPRPDGAIDATDRARLGGAFRARRKKPPKTTS